MRLWDGLVATFLFWGVWVNAFAGEFKVWSSAGGDQGMLPGVYSCDGKDISPGINWSGEPERTVALALIVADPDAATGTFYHWVLYNIPRDTSTLGEDIQNLPSGTLSVKNSFGKMHYNGPCPPKNSTHHYIFTLYALDSTLKLAAGVDAETLNNAMKKHVLNQTKFTLLYHRQ